MLMWIRLPQWLYPPKFADEERTRIASLVNILIWALVSILLLNEVGRFLADPRIDSTLWNRVAAILLLLALRWLMWVGYIYWAAFGLCLLFWSILTYYIAVSGGLHSPVVLDLGVTVVIAAILVGSRGTLAFGVICILTVLVIYFGNITGRFVSLEPAPTESRLLVSTLTAFGSLTVVAAIGAYSTKYALAQSRRSRQALREQNEILHHEIIERKRAQDALVRLASIIESTVDFVGITDENGKVIYINQAGRKQIGLADNKDVTTSAIPDYHPPDVAKMLIEQALPAAAQSGAWTGETVLVTHDKQEIPVLQTVLAHRDEVGHISYYSTIMHDLSERKRAEQQNLEFAADRERFTAFKELLTTISHDLKTPLSILDLNLYLLEKLDDPALQKLKIDSIRHQTKRMEKYILDILAISQLEQLPNLTLTRVNLVVLLDSLIKQLQPAANGKNMTLSLDVTTELLYVQGDADELSRALGNLVENALIYTPADGCVTVSARTNSNEANISIVDNGIGISPEALPHIFERSYRSLEARNFNAVGTGFGLAIVQKIIEMHHGRIEVHSTLGSGSTFQVYLPIA